MERVQRKKKDGTSATFNCPSSLVKYNQYMGGVDRNDQLRGYYHIQLKCRKYYKYIFWFLFDLAITNLYILYHEQPDNRRVTLKEFRVSLAHELIDNCCGRKRMGRHSILPSPRRFCQEHFPMIGSRRCCYYCYHYKKERRDTPWSCKECQLFFCHTGHEETDCF